MTLLEQAASEAHAELNADRPRTERLLHQLHEETKTIEAALDRYFDAFENGALSADECKHRLDELARRRNALEQRRVGLEVHLSEEPAPPTAAEFAQLAAETAAIIRKAKSPPYKDAPAGARRTHRR